MYLRKTTDDADMLYADSDQMPPKAFWEKKGFIISCLFSAVWLAFIYDYVISSGWWVTRYDLSPAELAGNICGLFLPIVLMFLVTAYLDRSVQLKEESDQLRSYLKELVYPTQEGADYTRTLTDALKAQIKEFRSVFSQVNKETQSVRDDLKQWIGDLGKVIKHVDTKTISSVREIADHIQHLTSLTEEANNRAAQTGQQFIKQAETLTAVTNASVEKISLVADNLKSEITDVQNLVKALENAYTRTDETSKSVNLVVQNMNESSKKVELAIGNYEKDAVQYNKRLFNNLEKVLEVFKKQGVLLESEVQKMTNRLTVLQDSLNGNAKGMLQVSGKALSELEDINIAFEETSAKVEKILSTVKQDVVQIETSLSQSVQKAAPAFPTAKDSIQADLLADATVILDRLQTFSVDMAHIFTPKTEDMLWKKYYDGDKAVFMRHITKMISESQHKKIVEFYKHNDDFKLAVTRYMSEFEGMTKKAQEGEESKLLMSVLIGSDVGRLYMVLADVLKKEL